MYILMYKFSFLQSAIKLAGKNNVKKLHSLLSIVDEKPKVDIGQNNRHNEHHIKNHYKHNHYSHNSILPPSTLNQVIKYLIKEIYFLQTKIKKKFYIFYRAWMQEQVTIAEERPNSCMALVQQEIVRMQTVPGTISAM